MDINTIIASRIKAIRLSHNYKAETVARSIGMSSSSYSELENGKKTVTAIVLYHISCYYDTDVSSFYENLPLELPPPPKR